MAINESQVVMQLKKKTFLKKTCFFRTKNLASKKKKKTLKTCFFFFQNTHLKEITS